MNISKKEIVFFLLVWMSMAIFFTIISPLVMYDGDDWVNLGNMRVIALPKWGDFNPSKVLPETSMPFVGLIGAYIIYPIINDYVLSITIASALFISISIAIYVYMFKRLIVNAFDLKFYQAVSMSIIFLLLHFLILKAHNYNNIHVLYSKDLTCYFHYVQPFLLNASLVMYLLTDLIKPVHYKDWSILKISIFIFICYLAVFSNLLSSIVLIAFIIGVILLNFKLNKNVMQEIRRIWDEYVCYRYLVIAWIISLVFEANGGRSNMIGKSIAEMEIIKTVDDFLKFLINNANGLYVGIFAMLLFCGGAIIIYFQSSKEKYEENFRKACIYVIVSIPIWLCYTVLVSAKTGSPYIVRPDVNSGFFFYFLLIIMVSASYIISKKPKMYYIVPILILIMFSRAANQKTLLPSNCLNAPASICVAVDNDIIQQCIYQAENNVENPEIHVPVGDDKDNWPIPLYRGGTIFQTLYYHGIIDKYYDKALIVPDASMNKKYGLER